MRKRGERGKEGETEMRERWKKVDEEEER
jgi:hypothetical protein